MPLRFHEKLGVMTDVIVAVGAHLFEHYDEVWGVFQIWFLPGCSQMFQVSYPGSRHSFGVVYFFFSLDDLSDLQLSVLI